MLSAPIEIVDPQMLTLIENIQDQDHYLMYLTSLATGKFGKISSLEDWRINQLKNLGIKVNNKFPNTSMQQLDKKLNLGAAECTPTIKDDILFTCYLPKGALLKACLEHINFKPEHIIFVDDQ